MAVVATLDVIMVEAVVVVEIEDNVSVTKWLNQPYF